LDEAGFYTLTAEWLSPYSSKAEMTAGLRLEIAELFGKDIKLTITTSQNKPITELRLP